MKHLKLQNLIDDLQEIKMTSEEKSEVLHRSLLAIEKIEAAHEFSNNRAAVLGAADQSVSRTIKSAWYTYFLEKKFVPAMVLALLFIGSGGVSMAAESSLPGDLLYSVKINVNEKVRGLTAVTPEAKAKFALEITDRRFKEVALLSSQGRLNAETGSIIQDELLKQAGQIKNQVASLVSTNKTNSAQEISLNFESSLRAHELILEKLSNDAADKEAALAVAGAVTADDASGTVAAPAALIVMGSTTASSSALMAAGASLSTSTASATNAALIAATARIIKLDGRTSHIDSIIATLRTELATTTAARATLQAKELSDDATNKDKIALKMAELKLKAIEIKRIASTTPVSAELSSSSLFYISQSDSLISSAREKFDALSYADALVFLQKASQYLTDAETIITADDTTDPVLKQLISDALSVPNFSIADLGGVSASTSASGVQAGITASSTATSNASSTASSTTSSTSTSTSAQK